jgi:hypothetical protein
MIRRTLRGEPRAPFRYHGRGSLAVIGRGRAIADFGRLRLTGRPAFLTWLFVHLLYLAGLRNRVSVMLEWAYAYFTYRPGASLLTPRDVAAAHVSCRPSRRPAVERDGQQLREPDEIVVGRQDRQVPALGGGTDQEVGVGALQPLRAAGVEMLRGALVVGDVERFVNERPEVSPEEVEPVRRPDAAQQLLTNRTYHRDASFVDECPELPHLGSIDCRASPQRERPDRRVDEHLHRRRRCFL